MDFALEQNWREIFALAAEAKAIKHREEQAKHFYDNLDHEEDKKHKIKERAEKELKELEEAIATSAQLAEFNSRLDTYDTKTVEALMENREALDRIRDALRSMTEGAYVLPDGRHVFKTADGRQVFDEHGLEVSLKTIDPDAIGDNHPSWERYKAAKDSEGKLLIEQHALIEFQAKIDDARSHANKGDITKKDLDDLDTDLKASAPPIVRQKLGLAAPETYRDAKRQLETLAMAQQAAPIEDPSRRTPFAPAPY